jgi:hypothetical protein
VSPLILLALGVAMVVLANLALRRQR